MVAEKKTEKEGLVEEQMAVDGQYRHWKCYVFLVAGRT